MIALLCRLAWRNLLLYRVKTAVIAALLGSGAFLAVIGLTLLSAVEKSMRQSVIESISGHLQVYSARAKDDLALFGGAFLGRPDIGTFNDFAPIRDLALTHPNVEAFVPMGQDLALLARGNEMDELIDGIRLALREGNLNFIESLIDQLRFQLQQLEKEINEGGKISADSVKMAIQRQVLKTAQQPEFLAIDNLREEKNLQFLETQLAPISGEKTPIYLNYFGVDFELYAKNFKKFKIIEGAPLPQGQRGMLLNAKVRESTLKLLAARLFDRLFKRVVEGGVAIARDAENQRQVSELKRQSGAVLASLSQREAEELAVELADFGIKPSKHDADLLTRLSQQLADFLTVDDSNFLARKNWFYAHIAPRVKLYEISPEDTVIVRSYTRSGYIKSLPIKVYGVFSWEGLEDADLAGSFNLVDLVSFRELYGQMTAATQQELAAMRQEVGLKNINAADAESALFGEDATELVQSKSVDETPAHANSQSKSQNISQAPISVMSVIEDRFDPLELTKGLALNAAIKLKNPNLIKDTQRELQALYEAHGNEVKIVDWQAASGIIGQFVTIVRAALVFALFIMFFVGLVIINNSIIAGTLYRSREIGTMRAIGAQKSFVLSLFLCETAMTGLVGAILGSLGAVLVLAFMSFKGIPASNDVVRFLFSGPRLYPGLHWQTVVLTPLLVSVIATLASVFAARFAASVRPAEAMQEKE